LEQVRLKFGQIQWDKKMASLNEFISNVKSEGLMRTSRFAVTFAPPPGMSTSNYTHNLRKILLYCDTVNLPGINLETTQAKTFGEFREMPFNKLFDNINISFYVDNSMTVKKMFDDWMGVIQNPTTRSMNYYSNYITDITIDVFDIKDRSRYQVVLYQCYPKALNPVQMDYAGKEVMKLNVSMNYKYWRSSASASAIGTSNQIFGDIKQIPSTYFTDFPNFQTGFNSFENSRSSLFSAETASVGQGSILI
jgi:hypothetical protein